MPADRPRAWQYMGADGLRQIPEPPWLYVAARGEHYIATEPLTPDDIPLAPPVKVTAEDVAWADFYADQEDSKGDADWHELLDDRPCSRHHAAMAQRITERLAARQEGEQ